MRMHFPVLKPISWIKTAVENLDYKLTKPQRMNLMLILTAMVICGSLSLSKISAALLGGRSINTLSHFFSYVGLNALELMSSAVRFAMRPMNLFGISVRLAIDDTMKHHSKGVKTIANVFWLFDHVLQANCKASCIVFVYLIVNEHIRFPVGWRVYKQNGPSKWKLALEIIDDILKLDVKISVVLFDSWFCVNGFVKQLERRKLTFIGDMKSSNVLECRLPSSGNRTLRLTIGELLKFAKFVFKEVHLALNPGCGKPADKILYKTYSTVAYVSAFKGKYLIVHSIDERTGGSKTFVCNELSWEAQKILSEYSYRWMIEEFFGNAKGLCCLEEACIRSEQGGALALFLVSFVDLLISIELWKDVHNNSEGRLLTVSAIFAAGSEENLKSFLEAPEEHFEQSIKFWLNTLQKSKKQYRRARKSLVEMAPPSESTVQIDVNRAFGEAIGKVA